MGTLHQHWRLFITGVWVQTMNHAPIEAATRKIIEKIHGIVLDDRRKRVHEIAETLNISTGWEHKVLQEDLGMKKLSNWHFKIMLNFTVDLLTWVHHYKSESKKQLKQWLHRVNRHQRRPRWLHHQSRSWQLFSGAGTYSQGVVIDRLFLFGQDNSKSRLLDRLKADLKEKRPTMVCKIMFSSSTTSTGQQVVHHNGKCAWFEFKINSAFTIFFGWLLYAIFCCLQNKKITLQEEIFNESGRMYAVNNFYAELQKLCFNWLKVWKTNIRKL